MNELLTGFTSLPNLHPALVHFPIALLPAAVVFELLLFCFRRQREWLDRAASLLYVFAGVGAWAAYEAGERAVGSLGLALPDVQLALNQHSDSGRYSFWLLGALAVVRLALKLWDAEVRRLVPRAVVLAVAVCAVALVFRTADLGGKLVFHHGVGVAVAKTASAADPSVSESGNGVSSRLREGSDGSLEWRPLPEDQDALGSVLRLAPGSDAATVSWVPSEGGSLGLGLAVDGETMWVLPGVFGDVQVELEVLADGFVGEIGIAHHAQSSNQAGFLTVALPTGEFVLGSVERGSARTLDRQTRPVAEETLRLTVSAIGRHLRGLVGDEAVVHGHEPALPEGACGILLRGSGTLRVLALRVTPVAPS